MEKLRLKKVKVQHGKPVRVNLKLSHAGLKFFDEFKKRKACKTNSEVFDYILDIAETEVVGSIIEIIPSELQTRKIFTINEYSLARLRNIGKKRGKSLDEVVDRTLLFISAAIEADRKTQEENQKYFEKSYAIKMIDDIWGDITSLRHGMDLVFKHEYDSYDPENFNYWFANIEGGLQGVRDLAEKLFDQMNSEARDQKTGNGEGGKD